MTGREIEGGVLVRYSPAVEEHVCAPPDIRKHKIAVKDRWTCNSCRTTWVCMSKGPQYHDELKGIDRLFWRRHRKVRHQDPIKAVRPKKEFPQDDTAIDETFSLRAARALKAFRGTSKRFLRNQLVERHAYQRLAVIKNVGEKTIREIETVLARHGLKLGRLPQDPLLQTVKARAKSEREGFDDESGF